MKPEFDSARTNRLMLVLGAVYTQMLHDNPDLFFDYFIKIGLTHQLSLQESEKQKSNKESILFRYMDWTGLTAGDDALTHSRFHTGFIRVDLKSPKQSSFSGTAALKKYDAKSKKSGGIEDWGNEILQIYGVNDIQSYDPNSDTPKGDKAPEYFHRAVKCKGLLEDVSQAPRYRFFTYMEELHESLIQSWQAPLIGLPGEFVLNESHESTPYWSIHNLIAFIGEVLRCKNVKEIEELLQSRSQLRVYEAPVSKELKSSKDDIDALDKGEDIQEMGELIGEDLSAFARMLDKWRGNKPGRRLPVHIFAKMFTRFYYALGRIDDDSRVKYLGWTFNRYIIVFLNAVLVEETLYANSSQGIKFKNPTRSDTLFEQNIKSLFCSASDIINAFDWKKFLDPFPFDVVKIMKKSLVEKSKRKFPLSNRDMEALIIDFEKEASTKGVEKVALSEALEQIKESLSLLSANNLLEKIKEDSPFFHWVLSCPLWHPYLDPKGMLFKTVADSGLYDDEIHNQGDGAGYRSFLKTTYEEGLEFENLYPILNAVLVHVERKDKTSSPGTQREHITQTASRSDGALTPWGIGYFEDIVNDVGRQNLITDLRSRASLNDQTRHFINTHLQGKFSRIPNLDTGYHIPPLQQKIQELLQG